MRRLFDFRTLLLSIGVVAVSVAYVLLMATTATLTVHVEGELARHWQTTYDLLVRPPGSRLPEEIQEDMARVNYLADLPPGITREQYRRIRAIPGVDVAAPVSMVGVFFRSTYAVLDSPPPTGLYRQTQTTVLDNGLTTFRQTAGHFLWYYDPASDAALAQEATPLASEAFYLWPRSPTYETPFRVRLSLPILLAGVDPQAEARLVGLDHALASGDGLEDDLPFCRYGPVSPDEDHHHQDIPGAYDTPVFLIPVIARTDFPLNLRGTLQAERLQPLDDMAALLHAVSVEGPDAFQRQPVAETLPSWTVDAQTLYRRLLAYYNQEGRLIKRWFLEGECRPPLSDLPPEARQALAQNGESPHPWGTGDPLWSLPGPVAFTSAVGTLTAQPTAPPAAVLNAALNPLDEPIYRAAPSRTFARVVPLVLGTYDAARLGLAQGDVSDVPVETYAPARALAVADAQGEPLPQPVPLRPGLSPLGYLQSPPTMLTTLNAACAILGEPCISAIRVRVQGAERYTSQAQQRLEAVAAEIVRQTGLEVDIVTGSSPREVRIFLPGAGRQPDVFLEEPWVQKGVHLHIRHQVQRGNRELLGLLILLSLLYTANASAMWVTQRRSTWAIMRATGWRRTSLMGYLLATAFKVGLIAAGVGVVLGWGLREVLHLASLTWFQAAAIAPLSLALVLGGMLVPAWQESRRSVVSVLKGTTTVPVSKRAGPWWLLARHPREALTAAGILAGAAALTTVLVGGWLGLRGYLQLTLLGQYLLVQVQGYHVIMLATALLLSALAVADVLLMWLAEHRYLNGLFQAVGWRSGQIIRFWMQQALGLTLLGSLPGSLLGLALLLTGREPTLALGLAWLVGLILPALVGALAAWFPARRAARVPPAQVLREG